MEAYQAFLTWLEELPISIAIAESSSIWGFPFLLVLHTIGICMTAGIGAVISLRIMGVAKAIPLAALRPLFLQFWIGFAISAVSGTLLFLIAPTTYGVHPMYLSKIFLMILATLALLPMRTIIRSDRLASDSDIPARVKIMAAVSPLLWISVIATGRLIGYFSS